MNENSPATITKINAFLIQRPHLYTLLSDFSASFSALIDLYQKLIWPLYLISTAYLYALKDSLSPATWTLASNSAL